MDNATKNKLTSGTDQADLTTGNACWETPPLVFEKLNEDFGPFDVDLTADGQRHLCPRWFGPESSVGECDALKAAWIEYGRNGYSNPPYGPFIQRLLHAAWLESQRGFTSTLLLPMRVTKAFKEYVLNGASELLFCDKRLTFFENGVPRLNEEQLKKKTKKGLSRKPHGDGAVFDSIVVRYVPGETVLKVRLWQVPKHVTAADLERALQRREQLVAV